MPKQPRKVVPTKKEGQYSIDLPNYLVRIIPGWGAPSWYDAERWRKVVQDQPIASICRDTLIANVTSLDWKISPRDSSMLDELKSEIEYYTKLFSMCDGLDFTSHVEWIASDLLDIPFGGASEIGREYDKPDGKVMWIKPLDGATLVPTNNLDHPVLQRVPDIPTQSVYFPSYAIDRIYWSPRREISLSGWGMPPPEKLYLLLEMLYRGDKYYANLLLDTPMAGILDLGDMEKAAAMDWVNSLKSMLSGIDPFKIPVMYEHTTDTKWIPFGKPPTDILFDTLSLKYAALVCAGYGMTLTDIGLSESGGGGGTLAGAIRQERKTRRTGLGTLKRKMIAYFNNILPPSLQFNFIDYDDESVQGLGRARLSSMNAFDTAITQGVISPAEARSQLIADGLLNIPIPEEPPKKPEATSSPLPFRKPDTEHQIGDPVPPSQGGQGDIGTGNAVSSKSTQDKSRLAAQLDMKFHNGFSAILLQNIESKLIKLEKVAFKPVLPQMKSLVSDLTLEELEEWNDWYDDVLFERAANVPSQITDAIALIDKKLDKELDKETWWKLPVHEESLAQIFASMYAQVIEDSSVEIAKQLYYEGSLTSPYLNGQFSVRDNIAIMTELRERASKILSVVNEGTKHYVKRTVLSHLKEELSKNKDKILDNGVFDGAFFSLVASNVVETLRGIFEARVPVITDFELLSLNNTALVRQFERIGLTTKTWHCNGKNPCPMCIDNEAVGPVPLDFAYKSVFEGTNDHVAHTGCYCTISWDEEEVSRLGKEGKIAFWFGD